MADSGVKNLEEEIKVRRKTRRDGIPNPLSGSAVLGVVTHCFLSSVHRVVASGSNCRICTSSIDCHR